MSLDVIFSVIVLCGFFREELLEKRDLGRGVVEDEEERMGMRIFRRGGVFEDVGVFGIRFFWWFFRGGDRKVRLRRVWF